VIACGSSASVIAALAGVLVARPFETTLAGEEGLRTIDVTALASALRGRGAPIEGRFSATEAGRITLPLVVGPLPDRRRLSEMDHDLSAFRPDIKCALLLSGLWADGPTYIHERVISRDHVVRLLDALGVPIATAGSVVELDPSQWSGKLPSFSYEVAGDFSAAMILLAAASLVEGSRICVRDVGLNPARTGGVDLLRSMGGAVDVEVHAVEHGEPRGMACASFAPLRATTLAGEALARADLELSTLIALAARARGATEVNCAMGLASSDRELLMRLVDVLHRFGVPAEPTDEGIVIDGRPEAQLHAAEIDAHGSAEVGAAAILLGLLGTAPSRIRGIDTVANRFPRLIGTLRALGAEVQLTGVVGEPRTE
jgi:3-phosphoshikimate 1-carboxyvinyltransferase